MVEWLAQWLVESWWAGQGIPCRRNWSRPDGINFRNGELSWPGFLELNNIYIMIK
jgi:hypothetical protein